jgi:two-component system LytT family response regulator
MNAPTLEPIAVLVADDELPARQRLMDLLRRDDQVASVTEAADGQTAVEMIQRNNPDLIFLDVQMPELDGLAVIDAIGAAQMPLTVFVTAYDQHAIRAFEANALDYLLKPFSDERFEATMTRAKARLDERSMKEFGHRVMKMVSAAPSTPERRLDRLVVKAGGTTRFIRVVDIDWIEAAGVYVTLHVGGKELLYRAALNDLAEKLDPRRFVRVHRSALINIESVLQLEPISHGEFEAVLKNGSRTRVSRTYRVQLEKRLGQPLERSAHRLMGGRPSIHRIFKSCIEKSPHTAYVCLPSSNCRATVIRPSTDFSSNGMVRRF